MKKRENGLDLLKIIAAFMVVAAHVENNGLNALVAQYTAGTLVKDYTYYFFVILRIFCTWAVPLYIMASGAFVLASPKTADHKSFYKKAVSRLVKPTVVFSIIYTITIPTLYYVIGAFGDAGITAAVKMGALNLAKGIPSQHMWYMYTLVVIYLMAPFTVAMKEKLGEKGFAVAACILVVWGCIDNLTNPPVLYWDLGYAINNLGVFMLGYVLREKLKDKSDAGRGCLFILLGIAAGALQVLVYETTTDGDLLNTVFAGWVPYNILNTIMAAMFFAGVSLLPVKKSFGKASALTYWVYLAHPLVILAFNMILSSITGTGFTEIAVSVGSYIPVVIVIFVISYALAWLIDFCITRRQKRTLEKTGATDEKNP